MYHSGKDANARGASLFSLCWFVCVALLFATNWAHATRYVYDDSGRVVGVVNQNGEAARYHYDGVGNLISVDAANGAALVFALQPNHGPPGTVVTIVGNALPVEAGALVLLSGTNATETLSATPRAIQFTVPSVTTGSHALTLQSSGITLAAGQFTVTAGLGPPSISHVSLSCAVENSEVQIVGIGFDVRPGATRVEVGDRLARVTAITETSISFRAPLHVPGGPVRVITEEGIAQSANILYIVSPTGQTCVGMASGVQLVADGGAAATQLSSTNPVAEYAFFAERGQKLSLFFSSPSSSSYAVEAKILGPEGRNHPLLRMDGTAAGTQTLSSSEMSLHLSDIARTGYHVLRLEFNSGAAVNFDTRLANVQTVQKGGIVSLQASAGQWIRMRYRSQPGDQISVGLQATNSSSDSVASSLHAYTPDFQPLTPAAGSWTNCTEETFCALNVVPFEAAGEYPFVWRASSTQTVAQATIWFHDIEREALLPGVIHPIAIGLPGEDATFPVYAEAGGGFSVALREMVFSAHTANFATLRVFTPSGASWPVRFSPSGYLNGTFSPPHVLAHAFLLPETGYYRVIIDPDRGGLISGEIKLDAGIPLEVDGPTLVVSEAGLGKTQKFNIAGNAGQTLGIGLKNILLAPTRPRKFLTVSVLLPSGDPLGSQAVTGCLSTQSGCEVDVGPLPISGTYSVIVTASSGTTSASYEITASTDVEANLGANYNPIVISRPGGNARLKFSAVPGAAQTIQLNAQMATPSGASVTYSVLRPDGTPLLKAPLYVPGSVTGPNPASLRIGDFPLAGTYTVFVDPDLAAISSVDAKVTPGVLDNSPTPVLLDVVPGPWYYATISVPSTEVHTGVGVALQSIVNSTQQLRIEMVDPVNRLVADYGPAPRPLYAQCANTAPSTCDFDLITVDQPGTYQVVVWPGTPRREDAVLSISQFFDQESTGRDHNFALTEIGQNARLNFSANLNESLRLVLTRQASSYPNSEIRFFLLDAFGNELISSVMAQNESTKTLSLPVFPAAGDYSILLDVAYGAPALVRVQLIP